MKLIGIGRVPPVSSWRTKRHRHNDFNELIVVIQGRLLLVHGKDRTLTAKTGDILLYPKGCWHEEASDEDDPVETLFISFSGQMEGSVCLTHNDDEFGRRRGKMNE